jgi:ribosomal protein L11 methyltransferase
MTTTVARLACDQPTARRLAAYLGESLDSEGTACAAFEDDGGQWQVAVHFRDKPDEAVLRTLVAIAAGEAAAAALTIEPVAPADWVKQSLAGLKPVRAGRCIVHGAHDRASVKPNDIGIEIEAALAFGTGHHGTTRGCLLALDELAKRQRNFSIPPLKGEGRHRRPLAAVLGSKNADAKHRLWRSEDRGGVKQRSNDPHPARFARHPPPCRGRDKKILDVGTGSGVLAIAAAKILRAHVTASDIDPVAVEAARANARLNRAAAAITFVRAAGANARAITAQAPYDLIFANILLGPLLRLAVPLRRLAAPGARIVLSGLLPGHANAVLAIYRAQGLALERRIPLDGWVTLVLRSGKQNRPGRR